MALKKNWILKNRRLKLDPHLSHTYVHKDKAKLHERPNFNIQNYKTRRKWGKHFKIQTEKTIDMTSAVQEMAGERSEWKSAPPSKE